MAPRTNGSGKSATVQLIPGLAVPNGGSLAVRGRVLPLVSVYISAVLEDALARRPLDVGLRGDHWRRDRFHANAMARRLPAPLIPREMIPVERPATAPGE